MANWDDHEVTNDFRGPTEPLMHREVIAAV
ncbi:MAG: alkaline phosphatase D family protein [Actinomycetota bacterium]|nr:alkaline phosphatase D family protein [Actinomycetota bacterium]